jgi:hypothetical protein
VILDITIGYFSNMSSGKLEKYKFKYEMTDVTHTSKLVLE